MLVTEHPIYKGYGVSEDGRVWTRHRQRVGGLVDRWRELRVSTTKRGYKKVYLKGGLDKPVNKQVHHLVLETFTGPRPEGMECRHLDGNPANNALSNLKWGTAHENYLDRVEHGTAIQCRRAGQ